MKTILQPIRLTFAIAIFTLLSIPIAQVRAAVANVAVLQGSLLEDGSADLVSATPMSIQWTGKSSIDATVFEHSFNDATKLVVKQDGDYLVAATVPFVLTSAGQRPSQVIEVYVNGEPAPGTVGQSSYIRNANGHAESSDHVHALLTGLNANDVIELRVHKHSQVAQATGIQSASLYVELIDGSRTVFAGLSSGPTQGTNLNPDFFDAGEPFAELGWTSTRKDAGFNHSDGSSGIGLSAGMYLVFANVPMTSGVQRASAGLEVALNGNPVPGGVARQGYIRNSGEHTLASVHWAGLVQVTGNQTLTFQMSKMAEAGEVIIQDGKQASAYVERIDSSSGVFFASALTVDNVDDPFNWNPNEKAAIFWETPNAITDNSAYSRAGGNTQIQVRQTGSYLLVYNDSLQSTAQRPSPKITVEVNGSPVRGAEITTHYIRNASPHSHATGTLVFLLEDLAANDAITVSTQREAQSGDVNQDEFANEAATLALIRKDDFTPAPGDTTAPRFASFNAGLTGFEASIHEFGLAVDPASVEAVLDGESVNVNLATARGVTTLGYSVPEGEVVPGGNHVLTLSFADDAAAPVNQQFDFSFSTPGGQPTVLLADPFAYWRLADTSGTTASEEIGSGADGTYTSATGVTSTLGMSPLALAGNETSAGFEKAESQAVTIPDFPGYNLGGPWPEKTIELWFRVDELPIAPGGGEPSERQVIFDQGGTTRGLFLYLSGTQASNPTEADLYFVAANVGSDGSGSPWGGLDADSINVKTLIQKDQVYHVVAVMDGDSTDALGGTLDLYLNGASVGSVGGVGQMYEHTNDGAIAAQNSQVKYHDEDSDIGGLGNYFDGIIDDVVLYNTAFSAEDVAAHFKGAFTVDIEPGVPNITRAPQSQSVPENTIAAFDVEFTGTPPWDVTWFKNDVEIGSGAGIGVSSVSFLAVGADNGAQIKVVVTSELGEDSAETTLSVEVDTVPPQVLGVRGVSGSVNQVIITFNELLDTGSATLAANYKIQGLTVLAASLDADQMTVTLSTSQQTTGTDYTVDITGVKDASATGNEVAGSFSFPSSITYEEEVLIDNPTSYWRLGAISGDTAANASFAGAAGQGNYLSAVAGGTLPSLGVDRLVVGAKSTAVAFDKDQSQYVFLPDHVDFNLGGPWEQRTIELWFMADRLPADPGDGNLPEKQILIDEGGSNRGLNFYLSGTQTGTPTRADLYFHAWNINDPSGGLNTPWGGVDNPVAVSATIQKGEVYHVVGVFNGDPEDQSFFGTASLYVNGELVGTTPEIAGLLWEHTDDGGLGVQVTDTYYHDEESNLAGGTLVNFYDGILDEVALYNTALSAARIKAHFDAGTTEVPFEPGDAPTISVTSGAGGTIQVEFTGTLQSAPAVTGPWTDVAGGSPASINTSQSALQFFRAR